MATDPNALLLAASIFSGQRPNMADPRIRAMFGLPPVQPGQALPVMTPPMQAPVPVTAPQPAPAGGIGAYAQLPQMPSETPFAYDVRHAVMSPFAAISRGVDAVAGDIRKSKPYFTETPADQARARTQQQGGGGGGGSGSAFPASYSDPAYDQYEAAYAQGSGNPTIADMLARLRTHGERSNANQTSSAGAKTPYQITPQTRAGIMKQYGFDPWSSPQNAVRGAAIAATAYTGMGANFNDPQVMARAAGGYFAGKAGADNPFGAASDGNNTTGQYVSRVMGPDTQLPAPFLNPYDPRYDKAAMGEIAKERQALMTPFSASVNVGPAPDMPKPEPLPQTDFTAADNALAAMHPIEMSEKDRLTRERDGFFKGIGQAMMHAPGNEGLGTLLMRIGGGALAGREGARDEIRAEQDKFDEQMSRYNAAVYQNELGKAQTHAHEAQATIQQNNEYNMNNWKVAYDRWTKNGTIDISGTNALMTQRDDKGNITVHTIPIAGAVDAAIAQQSAQMFQSMGGRQLAGNQQVTSMTNAIVGRQAIVKMMTGANDPEASGAAAAAPAFYGTFIATHGLTGDLLGPDQSKSLEESVSKQLQGMQLIPGSTDWTARHDKLMATELAKIGLASPQMMRRMMEVGGTANSFEALDALRKSRTRTSTDSRGMPQTSTTEPGYTGDAADIFSQ